MYKFKFLIFEEIIVQCTLCPVTLYWRTLGSRRSKRSPYTACSIIMNIRQPLPFCLLIPLMWQASQSCCCPEVQMCSFSIVGAASEAHTCLQPCGVTHSPYFWVLLLCASSPLGQDSIRMALDRLPSRVFI